MLRDPFRLKVQKVQNVCLFELAWGQGQQLTTLLEFPTVLADLYQDWRRVYLCFYRTLKSSPIPLVSAEAEPLRGRVAGGGGLTAATDWRTKLVEAETRLLNEFHRWLRDRELFEIRAAIVRGTQTHPSSSDPNETEAGLDVFLTCSSLELARLPWEAWEIGTDFATTQPIRIVRSPANIQRATSQSVSRRQKARILAILGDDTGLDFQVDRAAVQSLHRVAEIHFVGWQPGQTKEQVKEQILQAIEDETGWDVLFFAGHSNETQMTGGELAIAPGVSLLVNEIATQLTAAQTRGLQFAIFNSCSGLSIAESLINLGFSQVAIMREPIHNCVAQEFLIRFLQSLAAHETVQEALISGCQFLRSEKNSDYPSSYLVPSLFCHPGAQLFRIPHKGWKQKVKRFLPNPVEAIAIASLVMLSWQLPIQSWLIDQRIWVQAIYRNLTGQIEPVDPQLLLVQIDDQSLMLDRVQQRQPMSRAYLARLLEQAIAMNAKTIGLDYLLDSPQPEDAALQQVLRQTAADQDRLFIFAANRDDGEWLQALPELTQPDRSWHGDMRLFGISHFFRLLPSQSDLAEEPDRLLPLGYLLALSHDLYQSNSQALLGQQAPANLMANLYADRMTVQPLTRFADRTLGQLWFRPIVDYSIPPDRVFAQISAWEFLRTPPNLLRQKFPHSTLMIIPSGYDTDGIGGGNADDFPLPKATRYWRRQQSPVDLRTNMPGGEIHAYAFHQYHKQHFVMPIPDLWLIGVAVIAGKLITIAIVRVSTPRWKWYAGFGLATVTYCLISLQLYCSITLLIPCVLPTTMFWACVLPNLIRRKKYV
jgi:hypothetical protein